ncbi:hypothetical protein ALC62_08204 [Cyphomyrmex costatus]|uniref:Uncharacterized protein n=1 Tax=Cyphomyrmex costatus TaxID=456900 RepID=A0A195CJT9_9HYME|nr:hypothetical protein ALC62_08204 [Cyphomyrmex costatus]
MIAVPNDTALATRLQLFCGTLDTRVTSWQLRNSLERRDNAWHLAILLAKENLSRARNLRSRITYRDSLKLDRALSRPPKEQNVFRIEIFTTWSRQRNTVNRLIPIVNTATFIRFHYTIRE